MAGQGRAGRGEARRGIYGQKNNKQSLAKQKKQTKTNNNPIKKQNTTRGLC